MEEIVTHTQTRSNGAGSAGTSPMSIRPPRPVRLVNSLVHRAVIPNSLGTQNQAHTSQHTTYGFVLPNTRSATPQAVPPSAPRLKTTSYERETLPFASLPPILPKPTVQQPSYQPSTSTGPHLSCKNQERPDLACQNQERLDRENWSLTSTGRVVAFKDTDKLNEDNWRTWQNSHVLGHYTHSIGLSLSDDWKEPERKAGTPKLFGLMLLTGATMATLLTLAIFLVHFLF